MGRVDGNARRDGVLVTGSHRSGSTWVGRMLAAADELHYVQEPFNIVARQMWLGSRPPHQFLYLDETNGEAWAPAVQRVLDLRYPVRANLRANLTSVRSLHAARRTMTIALKARSARAAGRAPLIKDPIALFSTPWLVERFGLRPIVLVRDPVAFVGSLKERNWTFDFRHWTAQPRLMSEQLAEHRADIEAMVAADVDGDGSRPGIVEQGIVEWNAIYAAVDRMRAAHPEFLYVRYEQLAADPANEVPALYGRLGLRYGEAQAAAVAQMSSGSATGTSAIDVHRDSAAAIDTWKQRLTPDEVARVRAGTEAVAARLADI